MPETKIKLLPKKFIGKGEVKGYEFERIKSNKSVYMYRVGPKNGPSVYYEIFKRKINTRFNTETYPSSKQFGISAFTTPSLEQANKYFKKLTKKPKK